LVTFSDGVFSAWISSLNLDVEPSTRDAIMAGYAEDVEFVAPTVVGRWDGPTAAWSGTLSCRVHAYHLREQS
jgi:hypothetical protein